MTKGRRLTTSRSERFLGSYRYNQGQEREDDVWSIVDGMVNGDDQYVNGSVGAWSPIATSESNGSLSGHRSHRFPPPMPSSNHHSQVGGLSLAFEDPGKTASPRIVHQFRGQDGALSSPSGRQMATSAPVNVPDWSKIYRVDSVESLHESDDGVDDHESERVPPHEYLSRKMAANSVFEGVGRTLKGRDMSRVRDAVWSQTGFDG